MSKEKEQNAVDFQLILMEEVSFGMDIPEGYKSVRDYQFRISLESVVNEIKRIIIVTNRIDIRENTDQPILGHLIVKYGFEILDFPEHIKKNKKNTCIVPDSLQLSLNTIALSTTRGLLYAAFRGTPLHNALLPVIDAASFSKNEVE